MTAPFSSRNTQASTTSAIVASRPSGVSDVYFAIAAGFSAQCDVSNVKTVLVDRKILKQDFKLAASLGEPRKKVEASRDYLLSKFGDPEPGWLPAKATA